MLNRRVHPTPDSVLWLIVGLPPEIAEKQRSPICDICGVGELEACLRLGLRARKEDLSDIATTEGIRVRGPRNFWTGATAATKKIKN